MKAIVVTDQAAGTAGVKLVERPEPQAAINLGGHFKTGQRWSPQNRPTGLTQDKNLFYLAGCYLGKVTSENLSNRLHCADSRSFSWSLN